MSFVRMKELVRRLPLVPAIHEVYRDIRVLAAVKRHPQVGVLLETGFEFPSLSDGEHIKLIVGWYEKAVAHNGDGGVPGGVSLAEYATKGTTFFASYPETTGYILASLVLARAFGKAGVSAPLVDGMVSYLLAAQRPDGGFRTGAWSEDSRSLAFDTGQVLCGMTEYYRRVEPLPEVRRCLAAAAGWMASEIEADGSYSARSSFSGSKRNYYTRATIGLAHAGVTLDDSRLVTAAEQNIRWALSCQDAGGWFSRFSFPDGPRHNLHGVAYTLDGILEVGLLLKNEEFIARARLSADRLMHGHYRDLPIAKVLPGHYYEDFVQAGNELVPTGIAQFALVCFKLAKICSEEAYREYADALTEQLGRLQLRGFEEPALNGLLPGSWPVNGRYEPYFLPNWAIKFYLDCLLVRDGVDPLEIHG